MSARVLTERIPDLNSTAAYRENPPTTYLTPPVGPFWLATFFEANARIPSCRYACWLDANGLLATLLVACSGPQEPDYDAYYRGAWELTSIVDTFDATPRSPSAQEARTWHVFSGKDYLADTPVLQ